jgi:hypothetical protein
VRPAHECLHIAGGTFATVLWEGVLRGEMAANIGKMFLLDRSSAGARPVEKTVLTYALAFERDLGDVHWIAQAFQETILAYEEAIGSDRVSTYVTFDASKTFFRETLEFSTFVIYGADQGQWTFQPVLRYDYSDSIQVSCGVDVVAGGDEDEARTPEQVYVEVTYHF